MVYVLLRSPPRMDSMIYEVILGVRAVLSLGEQYWFVELPEMESNQYVQYCDTNDGFQRAGRGEASRSSN